MCVWGKSLVPHPQPVDHDTSTRALVLLSSRPKRSFLVSDRRLFVFKKPFQRPSSGADRWNLRRWCRRPFKWPSRAGIDRVSDADVALLQPIYYSGRSEKSTLPIHHLKGWLPWITMNHECKWQTFTGNPTIWYTGTMEQDHFGQNYVDTKRYKLLNQP